jgi:hypothetical protein
LGGHALARVARRGLIWRPQQHHHQTRGRIHDERQVRCLPGHLCLPCSTGVAAGQPPGSSHLDGPPPLPAKAGERGLLLQHSCCTNQQPAVAQPAPPSGAVGSAAANAGANPQPQPTGSQDNCHGKLVLPQLNRLQEAFKRSQVSHPASSSSQDQQPTRWPSPIPSQHSLTHQLTKHWPQFKSLRQHYASTRFEEQHQLHLPQKYKATVPESSLRVEMNALEEQADNTKARDLYWKPLSWLGTIRLGGP